MSGQRVACKKQSAGDTAHTNPPAARGDQPWSTEQLRRLARAFGEPTTPMLSPAFMSHKLEEFLALGAKERRESAALGKKIIEDAEAKQFLEDLDLD